MTRIEIRDLCKAFPRRGGGTIDVLDRLSVHAEDGEFVCLLGPSGCGKSTTLHILSQLVDADSGTIYVDGDPKYTHVRPGYVFQRPRLLNWKTVRQNLEFALEARGLPRREWAERVDRYLRLVGLESFADEHPLQLSGGMQQRAALARALAIEPDVLLMDEPFSSLDELTARTMRSELLKIWQRERRTVLFITHNALEAAYLADRIYVLSARPASVIGEVQVGLPRPRDMDDPQLLTVQKDVWRQLQIDNAGAYA